MSVAWVTHCPSRLFRLVSLTRHATLDRCPSARLKSRPRAIVKRAHFVRPSDALSSAIRLARMTCQRARVSHPANLQNRHIELRQ